MSTHLRRSFTFPLKGDHTSSRTKPVLLCVLERTSSLNALPASRLSVEQLP